VPAALPAEIVKFDEFELDCNRYELLRAGRRIKLEKLPMELLILFIEKNGHLLTRQEIVDRLWGADVFLDTEHGINTAIRKIRNVLRDHPEQPRFVQTVTGKGYRFIASIDVIPEERGNGNHKRTELVSTETTQAQADPPVSGPLGQSHHRASGLVRKAALVLVGAIGVVAVLGGLLASQHGLLHWRWSGAASVPRIQALAVLPLHNLSNDTEQEYFSEGMTDELITEISRFGQLQVISHSSVERYKEKKRPLAEIARELGVDAVVEGTVMRSGNRVRITARLIDAHSDRNLWTQSYERDLRDVLTLQDEVARQIATAVGVNLTAGERARLASSREVNPDAHEAYLRGAFYWNWFTCEGFKKGLPYFEQSVDKDPHFALAYLGVAQSYSTMVDWGCPPLPEYEALQKSKAAILKAIELDPNLGAAHAALGRHAFYYDWDWPKAEAELNQAIELDPNNPRAHVVYAQFLVAMGRQEQGLAEIRRALELDPTSLPTNYSATLTLYFTRQYDQAIDQGKKTVELYPDSPAAYVNLAWPYEMKGMDDESIAMRLKSEATWGATPKDLDLIRSAYQKSGMRGYWRHEIEVERARGTDNAPYKSCYMGEVYTHLGEKKRALEYLNRAFQSHCYGLQFLNVDPIYDSLREEPAFKELITRLRL
jgi:TolB-like protein/DNA-binding winged helix-turn-helix (wHTH) protein